MAAASFCYLGMAAAGFIAGVLVTLAILVRVTVGRIGKR